ncbi:hypothetical protein E2C01_092788 [Portunus trituberculatus]|uniref:Uncharacterized protein n=1 Tax=Portunus trituberculatus TaxID=210409 RepID=A0A5B7JHC7_PORTR|nr:hypothetical protein [Portunus trituberculatus]
MPPLPPRCGPFLSPHHHQHPEKQVPPDPRHTPHTWSPLLLAPTLRVALERALRRHCYTALRRVVMEERAASPSTSQISPTLNLSPSEAPKSLNLTEEEEEGKCLVDLWQL